MDHHIPGTVIYDGREAMKGYALNKMCYSLNEADRRAEYLADEEAYWDRFGLTPAQRDAIASRQVLQMVAAGGNIYYLSKLAGAFGWNVQDIGAQQTGMSLDAFKAKLVQAGA
jgi:protocatechuate 4,5-dioxygenase, alpha chain